MTLYLHSVLLLHCYAKQQMQALRHPLLLLLLLLVVVVMLVLLQFSLQLQQMMMELRRMQ